MKRFIFASSLLALTAATEAGAVTSAELYTSEAYQFGRFSARIQFAPGSGVVSSFFLWKDGSEQDGVFWNELDIEKLEAECRVETNTIYGDPEGIDPERHQLSADLCSTYHVYSYEWTPDYIAWSVDGVEIRRDTGETAVAFKDNTSAGMQLRFNVWPGDSSFGGDFDPAILPVYEYVDWVEYSAYVNGAFELEWREDFTAGSIPSGWLTGSWDSPKGLSTHSSKNVAIKDGYLVLALTADEATGTAGANPILTDPQAVAPAPAPAPPPPPTAASSTTTTPPPVGSAPATDAPAAAGDDAAGCSCVVGAKGLGHAGAPGIIALALSVVIGWRRRSRNG